LANLDQVISFKTSHEAVNAECEFKSSSYTTRTKLLDASTCLLPHLSEQDSTIISFRLKQSFTVLTPAGLVTEYSYSNEIKVRFRRLPRITTVSPLEVPAETEFYS